VPRGDLHDATNHGTIGEHVELVVVPRLSATLFGSSPSLTGCSIADKDKAFCRS
jgi:hypothetical protein